LGRPPSRGLARLGETNAPAVTALAGTNPRVFLDLCPFLAFAANLLKARSEFAQATLVPVPATSTKTPCAVLAASHHLISSLGGPAASAPTQAAP